MTELLQLPPDPILAVAAYLADDFPTVRHVRPEAQEVDPLGQREHGRFVIQFQAQRDQELFDLLQTVKQKVLVPVDQEEVVHISAVKLDSLTFIDYVVQAGKVHDREPL